MKVFSLYCHEPQADLRVHSGISCVSRIGPERCYNDDNFIVCIPYSIASACNSEFNDNCKLLVDV